VRIDRVFRARPPTPGVTIFLVRSKFLAVSAAKPSVSYCFARRNFICVVFGLWWPAIGASTGSVRLQGAAPPARFLAESVQKV
jgi:hypothetical protein